MPKRYIPKRFAFITTDPSQANSTTNIEIIDADTLEAAQSIFQTRTMPEGHVLVQINELESGEIVDLGDKEIDAIGASIESFSKSNPNASEGEIIGNFIATLFNTLNP